MNHHNSTKGLSILFIDPAVKAQKQLVGSLKTDIEIHSLNSLEDGIHQITYILNSEYLDSEICNIYIVSHGSPGCLYLGNSKLDSDSLDRYAWDLKTWFPQGINSRYPSTESSLVLYGCNVAAEDAGADFITKLHRFTGANVAASTSLTGNAALGGNWNLEVKTHAFTPNSPFELEALANYPSVLALPIDANGLNASYENLPNDTSNDYTVGGTNYNFQRGTQNNLVISGFNASPNGSPESFSFVQLVDQIKFRRIDNANINDGSVADGTVFEKEVFWYEKGGQSGNDLNLRPSNVSTMEEALLSNVINRGADNIFANSGGDNLNNIERVDFIASNGILAPDSLLEDVGFLLLERGGNDSFKVAAITAVDANSNPTAFANLVTVSETAWGQSQFDLATSILNEQSPGENPSLTTNVNSQKISGVFVSFDDLGLAANQTFFGYALFPGDVSDTNDLIGLTDVSTTTSDANGQGGLDLVAGGGIYVRDAANIPPVIDLDSDPAGDNDADYGTTFVEGNGSVGITDGNATIVDVDDTSFTFLELSVGGIQDGVSEVLIIDGIEIPLDASNTPSTVTTGGVTYAVNFSSGVITFTLNAGGEIPKADAAVLLNAIQYENKSTIPTEGDRTLQVKVNDGDVDSNLATATITVSSVNEPPVATSDTSTALVGSPVMLNPLGNDSDSDGTLDPTTVRLIDPITGNPVTSVAVPGEGSWSVNSTTGEITFTPEPSFTGDPTPITYTVNDNEGTPSNPATITLDYQVPPAATNDTSTALVGAPITLNPLVNDTDSDGILDPTTVRLVDPITGNPVTNVTVPGEGSWSVNSTTGEITFTPEPSFTGDPTPITYTVNDNDGNTSNPATITLDYRPSPVAIDDTREALVGTPVTLNPLANDIDDDGTVDPTTVQLLDPVTSNPVSTVVVTGEGTWSVDPTTGLITFTPVPTFTADPTPITYTVEDNDGNLTNPATVTIDYQTPPVATNDYQVASQGSTITLDPLANDTDSDGILDPTTVRLIDPTTGNPVTSVAVPGQGTWSVDPTTGLITFTPDPTFMGDPTPVTYTVTDNDGNTSNPATITLNYQDPPTVVDPDPTPGTPIIDPTNPNNVLVPGVDGTPITIDVTEYFTDPNGDPLTITPGTLPPGVTFDPITNILTVTPSVDNNGSIPITFTVDDGNGGVITPTITVQPVNPGPNAVDDAATTPFETPVVLDLLGNDSDPDGDPIRIVGTPALADPLTGTLIFVNGQWKFTPAPGFTGTAIINYTIEDQDGARDSAIQTITVNAATDRGTGGPDVIRGTNGNDVLNGLSDNDVLDGGAGNDIVNGGSERDILMGGSGDDVLNAGSGDDEATGGDGDDLMSGGTGDDQMTGDAGNDLLNGGEGHDILIGGLGQDFIQGGQGQDFIQGDSGDDRMLGGRGHDILIGGLGADLLTGGQGADIFSYEEVAEFGDIITDFSVVSDRIEIQIPGVSADNLQLLQSGRSTLVQLGTATVAILQNVNAAALGSHNFLFRYENRRTVTTPRPMDPAFFNFEAVLRTQNPNAGVENSRTVTTPGPVDPVFFDFEEFLQAQNPNAAVPTLEIGGLQLAQLYDETFYLRHNPDVANAVRVGAFSSGFDHFVNFGVREGRNPSVLYDEAFYLDANLDVAQAVSAGYFASGFEHFLLFGHRENRNPSHLFNQADYLTNYGDVAQAVNDGWLSSGFAHYVHFGAEENRLPLSLYEENFYLANHPDVAAAVSAGAFNSGLEHFIQFGQQEGRAPSTLYNEASYLALNADVAAAVATGSFNSGFEHYELFGRFEARQVFA